jgi:type IV pilus assembly protein PilZ
MVSGSERRVDARAPIELKIEYKSLNTFFADYTTNLSTRGTFIRTPHPLPIGTEFSFKLTVPQLDEPITMRGAVRWVRGKKPDTKDEDLGMGIEFLFDDDAQFETLREAVESLMRSTLGEAIANKLLSKSAQDAGGADDAN